MSHFSVIADLESGYLRGHRNEITLDQKRGFEDPIKFRGGTFAPTGYAVIVSGDRLRGDDDHPGRTELGYFAIRHDDDFPKDVDAPEFVVYLQDPGGTQDETMRPRLRLTTRYLEVHGQRLALGGTAGDRLISANGAYQAHLQDDGNLVISQRSPARLLWSWITGRL